MSDYARSLTDVRTDFITLQTRNFDSYQSGRSLTSEQEFYGDQFDRVIASVEREAAARALEEAVSDWESGTVEHDAIKYAADAPLGWTDESVGDAVMASGPVMDWLRARAAEIREAEG